MNDSTDSRCDSQWLVGPYFDVPWLFGGALLSLLSAAICVLYPSSILFVWWVWLLAFDGPHMMAAYTRTYLDKVSWQSRRGLLLGTLLCFAAGPFALALNIIFNSADPFLLFLVIATAYGYHHIVRQHYGFIALYKTKAKERDPLSFHIDKWALYIGCWVPYVYFIISHPRARAALDLSPAALPAAVSLAFFVIWLLSVVASIYSFLRGKPGQRSRPKVWYAVLTLLLHGAAYFVIGRFEPVYAASNGPDQDFLLLSVVLTIFHNVQYVALIYLHNASRYRAGGHGAASWLSQSAGRFLAVCLAFAAIYLVLAGLTGVFPAFAIAAGTAVGPFTLSQLGLSLWWGLALHHYLLDQRIWRIRDDPALRQHLRVA